MQSDYERTCFNARPRLHQGVSCLLAFPQVWDSGLPFEFQKQQHTDVFTRPLGWDQSLPWETQEAGRLERWASGVRGLRVTELPEDPLSPTPSSSQGHRKPEKRHQNQDTRVSNNSACGSRKDGSWLGLATDPAGQVTILPQASHSM